MVDILTGVPSIVAALFIYAVWVTTFWASSGCAFAVSLALVLLMIPVVVRSTEEMLKLVPNELREASYALGVPQVEDDHARSSCRRRSPASSPASCSASPGSWARPRRCSSSARTPSHRHRPVRRPTWPTLPTMINNDRAETCSPAGRPGLGRGAHPDPARPRCSTWSAGSSAGSARSS